ncbi:thiamine pyrophosphate-binding protein [Litoricolaceae bacterium]|nr:thiamine pyrophosphate-binding protein [Litorivicinaceae bacterium]
MINGNELLDSLKKNGISFFSGVADSTLGEFSASLAADGGVIHRAAVNEGVAVAQAVGYFLATGKTPCVYMQNSGLGNAVNPLTSLIGQSLVNCPLVMIIGWRGTPGVPDEIQHSKMGEITPTLLSLLGVHYECLNETENLDAQVRRLGEITNKTSSPAALLVRPGAINGLKKNHETSPIPSLTVRSAIEKIISMLDDDIVVSTTGYISRVLHSISLECGRPVTQNFYNVGSMGHASSVAAELSLQLEGRNVVCLDGDGAFLMHMGSVLNHSFSWKQGCRGSFIHVVLDNGVYESTGGQACISKSVGSISGIMREAEYERVFSSLEELERELYLLRTAGGVASVGLVGAHILVEEDCGNAEPRPGVILREHNESFRFGITG